MRNQYELDTDYFKKNLIQILRDIESHTPHSMARSLHRLSMVADENTVCELVDDYIAVMNEQEVIYE